MSDKEVKWVVSKYAKDGEGDKFEVKEVLHDVYFCERESSLWNLYLPKSEYIPCDPPERWETVPIKDFAMIYDMEKGDRFIIEDGKLVLQRKVNS